MIRSFRLTYHPNTLPIVLEIALVGGEVGVAEAQKVCVGCGVAGGRPIVAARSRAAHRGSGTASGGRKEHSAGGFQGAPCGG